MDRGPTLAREMLKMNSCLLYLECGDAMVVLKIVVYTYEGIIGLWFDHRLHTYGFRIREIRISPYSGNWFSLVLRR